MPDTKRHVLIVDDEPMNRELLGRLLCSTYELSEAADVGEALEILESESAQVHLILSDYLMPGMNGAELADIVRERWPGIPFLLITGYDDDEIIVKAQERGVLDEIVTKPWRSSDLRAAIANHLAR